MQFATYVSPRCPLWVQVSSDFSILDMDVAFAFGFAVAASMNALTNLIVNACITWQILFIVFPFAYAARKLQVNNVWLLHGVSSQIPKSLTFMRNCIHGRFPRVCNWLAGN